MQRVLEVLRDATGVDFAHYKRNTLLPAHHPAHGAAQARQRCANTCSACARTPAEVEALYQDILINVTSFFRNPEAYEALKATGLPAADRGPRRATSRCASGRSGCSTGEEAYSIAMAFTEYLEATRQRVAAADLRHRPERRRASRRRAPAIYPKGIAQDVSPERLRRFFVEVDGSYRIAKPIRDMCVFARQNVLADPPFSRIDLVTCRNLLIYLEPVLQQRLIPLLHYALRARRLPLARQLGDHRLLPRALRAGGRAQQDLRASKAGARAPVALPVASRHALGSAAAVARRRRAAGAGLDPQREADRLLLARYAPPGVLVDADLEILQFRGDTSAVPRARAGQGEPQPAEDAARRPDGRRARRARARAPRAASPVREEGLRVRSDGG